MSLQGLPSSDRTVSLHGKGDLAAAAQVIADEAKAITSRYSRRIPGTITVDVKDEHRASIQAGGPAGRAAPNAYMFETGARHPLFGDRHHWYAQPHRPFLEQAAERKVDDAMRTYADRTIDHLCTEFGYR